MHAAPTALDEHVDTAQAAIDAIAACANVEARTRALDTIGAHVVRQMEASGQDLALLRALDEVTGS